MAGLALLIGIDRFMSEARALTNLIGNGVATVVIARWEGALDINRMNRLLNGESDGGASRRAEADTPRLTVRVRPPT